MAFPAIDGLWAVLQAGLSTATPRGSILETPFLGARLAGMPAQVGPSSYTTGQVVFAYAVLAVIVLVALVGYYLSTYRGLDADALRHKQALYQSKFGQSPATVNLPGDEQIDTADNRAELRRALTGDDPEAGIVGRQTTWDALDQLRDSVRDALAPVRTYLPPPVLRYAVLGALIIPLGWIAVRTQWVVVVLTGPLGGPDGISLGDLWGPIQAGLLDLLKTTLGVWSLWTSLLPGSLQGLARDAVTWLVDEPTIVGSALLLTAGILLVVEHYGRPYPRSALEDADLVSARRVALRATIGLVMVWAWTVLATTAVRTLGFPRLALWVGLAISGLTTLLVIGYALWDFLDDCWLVVASDVPSDGWWGRESRPLLLLEILYRRVAGAFAALATAIAAGYLYIAIAEGDVIEVAKAYANAPLSKQVLVALAVVAPLVGLVYLARDDLRALAAALGNAVARNGVYALLIARGARWAAIIAGALVGVSFLGGLVGLVAGAVVAGVASIIIQTVLRAARVRLARVDLPDREPTVIPFRCYRLTDADGDLHHYVEVGGGQTVTPVAGRDLEQTIDEAIRVGEELATDDRPELSIANLGDSIRAVLGSDDERVTPSLATWHADRLLANGIVDYEANADAARERARKVLVNPLRKRTGRVPERVIEWRRQRFGVPPAEVDYWLETEYFARSGDDVRLLKDPWKKEALR